MKLNIANPSTGKQKLIEVDDEKKLRSLYEKRLAAEVDGEDIGEEFKGYVFKIAGGQDKQGFSMKQGVLTADRVKLMMAKGDQGCRGYGMRKGERYRKSVRGCIVSHQTSVLHLVIVKKGAEEIPGLTDSLIPRRLGPKRASKIRKLFALTKDDDVRKYVIRREVPAKGEGKKPSSKAPKIQRLVTPISLQRKRHRMALKKNRQIKAKTEAANYQKMLAQKQKEMREKRAEKLSQRKSQRSSKADE
jgi:small subunit ribosomal protein S6e